MLSDRAGLPAGRAGLPSDRAGLPGELAAVRAGADLPAEPADRAGLPIEPGLLPLSTEQAAITQGYMLRHWQFPVLLRLPFDVEPALLSRALGFVADRHEPLRMRLVACPDGVVRQRIGAPGGLIPVAVHEPRAGVTVERLVAELSRVPLDVWGAGPVRAAVLRRAVPGSGCDVLLIVHHLAWDNWCRDILVGELSASYRAVLAGRRPVLPRLRTSWSAHVAAQHAAGAELSGGRLEYWRDLVSDSSSVPKLARATEIGSQGWAGSVAARAPAAGTAGGIARFARIARVTTAAVWQTLLLSALAEEYQCDDFLYYFMHHGRDRPGSDALIGFFARSIVLRHQVDPAADLAARCRATLLATGRGIERSAPPYTITRLSRELDESLYRPEGRLAHPLSQITVNVRLAGPQPGGAAVGPAGGGPANAANAANAANPADRANAADPADAEGGGSAFAVRKSKLWFWIDIADRPRLSASYDRRRFPDAFVASVLRRVVAAADEVAAA